MDEIKKDIKVLIAYVNYLAQILEAIIQRDPNNAKKYYNYNLKDTRRHLNNGCKYGLADRAFLDECGDEECKEQGKIEAVEECECLLNYYNCTCGIVKY